MDQITYADMQTVRDGSSRNNNKERRTTQTRKDGHTGDWRTRDGQAMAAGTRERRGRERREGVRYTQSTSTRIKRSGKRRTGTGSCAAIKEEDK
jgi:hypothetical protein